MTEEQLSVNVHLTGTVGTLSWEGSPAPSLLHTALEEVCRQAFANTPAHRLVVQIPISDDTTRGVLHRAGFRLEGRLREHREDYVGIYSDVYEYARLANDPVDDQAKFTAVMNSVTPRKRLIAHALFSDELGRVLLCETSFKRDFELPGGIVESGEPPRVGVLREIEEELGLALPVGGILVTDWLPPYLGWEDALELVFDGGVIDAETAARIRPDGGEIVALHWAEPRVAAAAMSEIAGRHLLAALEARASGVGVYMESGRPV